MPSSGGISEVPGEELRDTGHFCGGVCQTSGERRVSRVGERLDPCLLPGCDDEDEPAGRRDRRKVEGQRRSSTPLAWLLSFIHAKSRRIYSPASLSSPLICKKLASSAIFGFSSS